MKRQPKYYVEGWRNGNCYAFHYLTKHPAVRSVVDRYIVDYECVVVNVVNLRTGKRAASWQLTGGWGYIEDPKLREALEGDIS